MPKTENPNIYFSDAAGFYKNAVLAAELAIDKQDPELMRSAGSVLFRAADALANGRKRRDSGNEK